MRLWRRERAVPAATVAQMQIETELARYSQRGRERAEQVRGGTLVWQPYQGVPHIRLADGSGSVCCANCAPLFVGAGAWGWHLPGLWQDRPWQCVLCCTLNLSTQEPRECLCCGLPRNVGLMLARGLWS